jgi:IS30 family transposase
MDSVIGVIGGKVLLTLQFEVGLMLAQIRDTNNSQSVIDYFDMLEQKFGTDNFKKIFPVILTDNGSEFSNPTAIETSIHSNQQRTRVFYCDPYASWQKAKVENNVSSQ